ncbi:hypothetical protein AOQ84DRAFT_424260 [Glonium stellatum]|uniref:Protein NO VEIN C-terminal domain-containing protein n=1 Tax=Glonium stellatum TaxID=574774 RepID=A0A8E2ENW8_9PEZI|nr:hypothetical protein AOQ84DRAFT_424260 [Glonium stellatum]
MSYIKESGARKRARKLVESIAKDHGYLSEDVLSRMPDDVRLQVEEAMLKKDEMIGSSVMTLAKNLYSSSARFVFELLQNADDNHYTKARAHGAVPFVSFRVYTRRIVLECNEDGFTRENLIAICNVGKSSKTGAQGYIGEKGIGFKSVFMAAWKAHIQSGDFSFSFRHQRGSSGIGMISPVWEDTDEELASPLTRITLFLHETGDYDVLTKQRETTLQQFRELQDTILLFMKNLRKIDITIYNENDQISFTTRYSIEHARNNRVSLGKKILQNGETQDHIKYYHITKHTAKRLPKSENRTYSEAEEATRAYAKAEVILAFPLTHDSIPIIEPQEAFAFLPVRHMGFTFLIQTDFVTQANRQGIVTSSARNARLLEEISDAFIEAVLQFCGHSTLQYQWMRYLPQENEYPWDPFWRNLIALIKFDLKKNNILRPRSHRNLSRIRNMRRLTIEMVDKNGDPLFDDVDPEEYLASEYRPRDLDRLKEYGLKYLHVGDMVARVRKDLNKSFSSRMKSPSTDEDWHSRAAELLSLPFANDWLKIQTKVMYLPLIPLTSGRWVSIMDQPVYYSNINGVLVPGDLNLCFVNTGAAENAEREQFFDYLGVQEPSAVHVRDLIMAKYECTGIPANISLATSRNHLTFLYLTAHLDERPSIFTNLRPWMFDHRHRFRNPTVHHFYMPNDQPYGAQELFRPRSARDEPYPAAPGFDVSFVNPEYINNSPEPPERQTQPWAEWLKNVLFIRDKLTLTDTGKLRRVLSRECLYVAQYRPEKFLGFLSAYWEVDGDWITIGSELRSELLKIKVLCKGNYMYPLGETYLPTTELQRRSLRFLEGDEFFPWLKLEAALSHDVRPLEWETLTEALGIGYPKSDLDFHLVILKFILDANASAGTLSRVNRVYELYENIQTRYHESDDRSSCRQMIRGRGAAWALPCQCLWKAIPEMKTKYPLKTLYKSYFNQGNGDWAYLTKFFTTTLSIPDVSAENFLEELKELKSSLCTDFDLINRLYESIDGMRLKMTSDTIGSFKKSFEDEALIYVVTNGVGHWFKVSQCLWSTATQIRGMTALNDHYGALKDLFVDFLGVRTLNLQMVFDKLKEQGAGQSSVEEVKKTIWLLNSLLQSERRHPSPKPILESRVFPVRHPGGSVRLLASAAAFVIADRKHLHDLFSGEAKFLDFSTNDIPRLEPFFKWAGLESRYLSCSVREISTLCGDPDRPISHPDRDISRKAHGLLRIAVHFGSPRAQTNQQMFYEVLQSAQVRETDGICSELHLNQEGNDLKVEVNRSELHIRDNESELKVYVPRNERAQDLCFFDKLPKGLLEWVMTEPSTQICERLGDKALNVMQKVLLAQKKYISEIPDREGIVSLEIPDDCDLEQPLSVPDAATTPSTPTLINSNISPPVTPNEPDSDSDASDLETPASHIYSRPVNHASPSSSPGYADQTTDLQYCSFLDKVIAAARRATFPSRGPFNMSELSASLTVDALGYDNVEESFRLRSVSQLERDKKIGAAGELFVFEVLSHLEPGLPSFSRHNWQSTIRKYVTVHHEYYDMVPWNGREKADITYNDRDGVLTSLPIDKGYLRPDICPGIRPKYFIEVKSTTGPCDTPFFMSKYQYQRMQNMSNGESGFSNPDCVYVIFRVFNLGQGGVGLRVYVDPDVMRMKGELSFTAETWSVVPVLSPGN